MDKTPEQLEAERVAKEAADKAAAEAEVLAAEKAKEEEARKAAVLAALSPEAKALIDAQVAESVKQLKANLDNAYAARDAAQLEAKKAADEKRAAEIQRLTDEGKHKEAYEIQLKQERQANDELKRKNVELTRDVEVRSALKDFNFRNADASEIGFKEIVAHLVQNDKGQWVHKSGTAIRDFAQAFYKDPNKSFLFKAPENNGSGFNQNGSSVNNNTGSLFKMSQADVLAGVAAGTIGRKQ